MELEIPFSILISGSPGKGKSSWIRYIVKEYSDQFDFILLFSASSYDTDCRIDILIKNISILQ